MGIVSRFCAGGMTGVRLGAPKCCMLSVVYSQ